MCRLGACKCRGDDGRGCRLNGYLGDGLALLMFNVAGNAADGAAGANAADQDVDGAVSVIPYFRAGGLFVNGRVGWIAKLGRHPVFTVAGGNFFGFVNARWHAFAAVGEYDGGAQGFHQVLYRSGVHRLLSRLGVVDWSMQQ